MVDRQAELFAADLRAAVDQHEAGYRKDLGRHRWNTLDLVQASRLADLGIKVKLPRSATKRPILHKQGGPEPAWVGVTASGWVADFVSDVDQVAPGGTVRIFTGEASPVGYNHPLVIESMVRAAKPAEAFLAHSKRGVTMAGERRFQDAVYDFQYAEELANLLGFSVYAVRRMEPSTKRILQAPLGDMFGRFGYSLMALGLPEQTRPRLERALGHNSRQSFVNYNLGSCLRILGEPSELVAKFYGRELKVNPAHPVAAEDLANMQRAIQNPKRID